MVKVYIWGIGVNRKKVERAIIEEECKIVGYIDNNPSKQGSKINGVFVSSFDNITEDYDYIIISVGKYESILYQLELKKFNREKVIVYFEEKDFLKFSTCFFIDQKLWRIDLLEKKVKNLESLLNYKIRNLKYELLDEYRDNKLKIPRIESTKEAIDKIVFEGCSLVRFGDGEFEIMAGKERAVFQKHNPILEKRMKEIIQTRNSKLLIAIANNYGSLECYTEEVANGIRSYMTEEVRKFHMSLLDVERTYYDAYMFKCYFPYKDKESTQTRFELVERIWKGKDVVLIEGEETRTGYANDLLNKAKSVKRILAPTKNAFEKYDEILNKALELSKEYLILVVLGPAGKLLTFDLFNEGYQVIDIGQIDMDYDWYKAEAKSKIGNPKKYISQLPDAVIEDVTDKEYLNQVLCRIRRC